LIDEVAEQALACWEREYDAKQRAEERAAPFRTSLLRLFFHPAVGVAGLAAAALILLSTAVLTPPDGLVWADPGFSALALRGGADPAEQSVLGNDAAERCQALLRKELERVLADRSITVQSAMLISMDMQELRNGAFSLSVQVRTRKGETVGVWSGDYSGEAAFKEQVGASAECMAEELLSWFQMGKGECK
jgi:hypothetical protein